MDSGDLVGADLVEKLRALLAGGGGQSPVCLLVVYPDGRVDVLTAPRVVAGGQVGQAANGQTSTVRGAAAPADNASSSPLNPTEQAILEVLARAEKPLKGRTVASRAQLRFTSHLRNTLARMAREGRLRKVEGYGYWLPGRELPPNLDD